MKIRALHRLLATLIVALFSIPALAQSSGDSAANQKIKQAINNHYLMMQLDQAEGLLAGAISDCGSNCSPQILAKAWMYIGIVRGSGKNDQGGASDAFAQAKGLDPSIALDVDLATPETKTTFDGVSGSAPASAPVAEPAPAVMSSEAPGAAPPPAGVPGDMLCSPQGAEIQTRMPIPFSCTSNAEVASGFIKFQEPGSSEWKKLALMFIDDMWQAELPCEFTSKAGELKFYVGVKDSKGVFVDQFGSKSSPASIFLSDMGVAPAFPGQAPMTRCGEGAGTVSEDCPPDFPGCSSSAEAPVCGDLDWGASCSNSGQCKCGLLCEAGSCATAPTCSTDAECDTNTCVDGYCSVVSNNSTGSDGPFKRHWLSLAGGLDLMPMSGEDLCNPAPDRDLRDSYGLYCYDRTTNAPANVPGVNLPAGITFGQVRIKLGYDYAIMNKLSLGLRAGFAFVNSHPSNPGGKSSFLPVHVAGRATYHFTSLSQKGLRPSLYLTGGLAESNGKKVANGTTVMYKIAGQGFGAPGGSLAYMITPNMGVAADVQLMMLFPTGGLAIAIHPALSFTYGL